jgi:hypothetical protein
VPKLDREHAIAVAMLALVLLACIIAPVLSLQARSNASQELAEQQNTLDRLEAAHQRAGKKTAATEQVAAPETAFLGSQTPGLASAQLEAYLSQLVLAQQASLISSGVQQANKAEPAESVRIQATLDIGYEALQSLLYKLETGTPYVFVESMMLQPPNSASLHNDRSASMKVTLNLRALWHQTHP